MKLIVLLQGMGNNERGLAKLMSSHGRVVLVQLGFIEHIEIWEQGQCVYCGPEEKLNRTRILDDLTFSSPTIIRSLKCCWRFTKGQKIDLVIGSAYALALAGLFLKIIGKNRKVVSFVADYLPPHGTLAVRIHRRMANLLTRFSAWSADEVWAVSPRIPTIKANPRNFVIPLCLDDNNQPVGTRTEIGYIGFPSPDHALDVLFDICIKHGLRLNIIGDSPYLQSIRHLAPADTAFHGIISDNEKIKNVLSKCFCGYAVYRDTSPKSYSYFGIPSKTLSFFASNTPVVTTNTAHFTQNIANSGAGCVVNPVPEEIEKAILDIRARFPVYYEAINCFRKTWNTSVEKFHDERIGALLG